MSNPLFYNMEGQPSGTGNAFEDVASSSWYHSAVNWAAEKGIVSGIGAGKFAPTALITREQMVLILYRYANYKGYETEDCVSLQEFSDAAQVSDWAKSAVEWAVGEGYLSGTSATAITPDGTATRAQIATVMMRFCEKNEAYLAFEAKNVEDFSEYEVINFDGSNETNFAVLAEDTIVTSATSTENQFVRGDEESGVYVFQNINEKISGLQEGDIFYHVYGPNAEDYVLMKVDSVNLDGATATITAGDAELGDLFEYIDVDLDFYLQPDVNSQVMTSTDNTGEELTYRAAAPDLLEKAKKSSLSAGEKFKFGIETNIGSVTAETAVKVTLEIKYDRTILSIYEISFIAEQETNVEAVLQKNLTGDDETYKKSSPKIKVPLGVGISAEFDVYFLVDMDAQVDGKFEGTFTSKNGVKWTDHQVKKIEESDSGLTAEIEGNFNIAMSVGVEGSASVLKSLRLTLSGEGGVEASGETADLKVGTNRNEKHLCDLCIEGQLDAFLKAEFTGKIFKKKLFTITPAEVEWKVADFYISFYGGNHGAEFGWGTCPHKEYLVNISVVDQAGVGISDTTVILTGADGTTIHSAETDRNGFVTVYCPIGTYTAAISDSGGFAPDGEWPQIQVQKGKSPIRAVISVVDPLTAYTCDIYEWIRVVGTAKLQVLSDTMAVVTMEQLPEDIEMEAETNRYCVSFASKELDEYGEPEWEFYTLVYTGGDMEEYTLAKYTSYDVLFGVRAAPEFEISQVELDSANREISWVVTLSTENGFDFSQLAEAHMSATLNDENK